MRQNNLKNLDIDIPLGRYTVVTGVSGAGKSSLVFDTLHAEGQRRYVETFSAYTRQFLELLDKPQVDTIENIRPSIAIEQTNTVKTSRSTVGTMTELTDFFKVWFSQTARCFDPETGEQVEDDNPQTIWTKTHAAAPGQTLIITFRVKKPANLTWTEILTNLKNQSYIRILIPGPQNTHTAHRIDDLLADTRPLAAAIAEIHVAQDRIEINDTNKNRFLEASETALHFGHGHLQLFSSATGCQPVGLENRKTSDNHGLSPFFILHSSFSTGLHSPKTNRTFRAATPALFSFNSPLGACPKCRGFGRVIEIDYRLAIPDQNLSIEDGAIKAFEGQVYSMSRADLIRAARRHKIPTKIPFAQLTEKQREFVMLGEPEYRARKTRGETIDYEMDDLWYGLKGFFDWLESTTYKMHVRVFLSRYRTYNLCSACHGSRLQPEALCWKWQNRTLPQLYQIPVNDLLALIESTAQSAFHNPQSAFEQHSAKLAHDSILTRLRYLQQVGLGYLTLDRTSKTLSGGEVERVNLTSCLGTSLVDTLFVLDEPSVGLHPRDIDRLIAIIRTLTDAGNTVVVVEHDESMIRAADHVIEIGPEPGARGGHIVFQGPLPDLLASDALTGRYLSNRLRIETPTTRRPVALPVARAAGPCSAPPTGKLPMPHLRFEKVTKHNLRDLSISLPLHRLVALSGVSGSGKSTLLDNVIHQGLLTQRHQLTEDPASIGSITGDDAIGEIVLVDQSPLSRTPRSNAALYTEAWELIRDLYAREPAAQSTGYTASSFSFNAGDGRCEHCQGLGFERVEMQFLSDVFVPCPICEGRRFKPEVLAIRWLGHSVADLLNTSVDDAIALFAAAAKDDESNSPIHEKICARLQPLADVGLGYLTLGQPLNTLSGGESQRLKLVRHLGGTTAPLAPDNSALRPPHSTIKGALLLLDEPTTGLHRHDVKRLIAVLQRLVDNGHSVIVIEHNLDILKSADWLIEIGPEAGDAGGRIVAEGTPEHIAKTDTATAPYLRTSLQSGTGCQPVRTAKPPLRMTRTASPCPNPAGKPPVPQLNLIGARENNLKNLSITLPHRALNVVTGVSGSGKSTLAFDIVFAEGQRRFMESMSPYARQFVEQLPRPAIDRLTGIPPTVAIEQRITRGSRKSTVATITEVAQYLRLLYARLGVQHHPDTDRPVQPLSPGQLKKLLTDVLASPAARRAKHLYLCAPLVRGRKGHHQPIATWIGKQGCELMRADGRILKTDTFEKLDRYKEHDVEAIIADLKNATPAAANAALTRALDLGKGSCFLATPATAAATSATSKILSWFSTTRTDIETGESFPELDPKQFSHNSPRGWCSACRGHGRIYPWMLEASGSDDNRSSDDPTAQLRALGLENGDELTIEGTPCPVCHGDRLNRIARSVKLHLPGRPPPPPLSLPQLLRSTPAQLLTLLAQLKLDERGRLITQDIVPQIEERLRFLDHVGLGYLTLDRPTGTLSGGEAQRIRLASQLGTNLAGVLYVLDEPSIGLHARDNDRLIETLKNLRDKGNTLLVVEHDDELMEQADHIIDLGPAAGIHGGELLAEGTPADIKKNANSLTGLFLKKGIQHPLRGSYRPIPKFK